MLTSVPPDVVMVHGAFCGGWTFDGFRPVFEAAGHACHTPDLPGHAAGGDPAGASMSDYARAVAETIAACAQPPVLIGHSLGGLVAQLAAARAAVSALILLAPSPPWGVLGDSLEEAASAVSLYALGPFWLTSVEPDYPLARRYSLDQMDREARRQVFARMVPESGRALWETLNWWLDPFMSTRVDPARIAAPVIAFVGDRDVIHPPSTVRRAVGRLGGETRVIPGMSHWLPGEPGSETLARECVAWIEAQMRPVSDANAARSGRSHRGR